MKTQITLNLTAANGGVDGEAIPAEATAIFDPKNGQVNTNGALINGGRVKGSIVNGILLDATGVEGVWLEPGQYWASVIALGSRVTRYIEVPESAVPILLTSLFELEVVPGWRLTEAVVAEVEQARDEAVAAAEGAGADPEHIAQVVNDVLLSGEVELPPGPEGPEGPEGPRGPAGLDGSDGAQGVEGPRGLPGEDGPQGPPGRDGIDGTDGAPGNDGKEGPQGPPGNDGIDGAEGPRGPQGTQGEPGIDGSDGDPGAKGDPGADGPTGPSGPQGPKGEDGVDGADGLPGPPGSDGERGIEGPRGADGPEGPRGLPGTDGAPGADGSDGLQGPPGLDGSDGEQGIQGPPGTPGKDGADGAQGIQGERGLQGLTGPDGPAGADGLSAYEVAVAEGFVGTEAAFLDSLVGPEGPKGEPGADGGAGPLATAEADGLMSAADKLKLDSDTPSNIPNTIVSRNSSGTSRLQHLYLDGTDPRPDQAVRRDYVDQAVTSGNVAVSPTAPAVVNGGVWVDSKTGRKHLGVDLGPDPIVNMATNPRFKSVTTNLGTTAMSNTPEFKAVTLNLTYQTVEDPSSPEYEKWVNRKVQIASFISSESPDLMAMQENQITPTGSSIQEVAALAPANYRVIEQTGSNNGAFYNSNTFELERVVAENIEVNKVFIDGGLTRNMTVAVLRHKASDQRLIYGVSHFNQATTGLGPQSRLEATKICGDFLNALAATYPDNPAILLSGDFNATTSIYELFSDRGLEASKNKATTTAHTDQGSYHGYNVNGNTSANWIDEHYTNSILAVQDSRLSLKFASGSSFPLSTDFLSDHHPVVAIMKFQYSRNVSLNYSNSEVTTGGSASVYYSTSWPAGDSEGSACIKPNGSSTASSFYPGGQSNGMRRLKWEAGKTYTVSATARLAAPLVSPPVSSRCIAIGCEQDGGSTNFSFAVSNRIPNEAGEARLSVTFTLPATTTDGHIRMLNGSATTPMWVDKLLVEEGPVGHDYFDGDTLGCYWEGVPHGSPSVYPGPSWVSV